MGSFNMTCGISGLSLEGGDKIKMILLSTPPGIGRDGPIGGFRPTDYWVPRTPPISCEYFDYGLGENFVEEEVKNLWMEGLKIDLIEKGVGDNQIHDVATSKDMSFEDMLSAIRESRIFVEPKLSWHKNEDYEKQEQIPSIKNVTEILEKHECIVNCGDTGYNVDQISFGQIRIRVAGYGKSKEEEMNSLSYVQKILGDHFVSIVINGGYGSGGTKSIELRVFAHPETTEYSAPYRTEKESEIAICMVRQDVWDGILDITYETWFSKDKGNIQAYRDGMKEFHEAFLEKEKALEEWKKKSEEGTEEDKERYKIELLMQKCRDVVDDDFSDRNPILYTMSNNSRDFSHYTRSLREHYEIAVRNGLISDAILDGITELSYVTSIMDFCRWKWMPSAYAGQEPFWSVNKKLHSVFSKVAAERLAAEEEENYDDE